VAKVAMQTPVYTQPVANFSAVPLSGTVPLTVSFSNSSSGATEYLWDFGDTITTTVVSPTHVYTQPGVYTVTLAATGPGGTATLTRTAYISVITHEVTSLVRAFAFGADSWTRATANEPGIDYTKVVQNGGNFTYTVSLGYGYTRLGGIDSTRITGGLHRHG